MNMPKGLNAQKAKRDRILNFYGRDVTLWDIYKLYPSSDYMCICGTLFCHKPKDFNHYDITSNEEVLQSYGKLNLSAYFDLLIYGSKREMNRKKEFKIYAFLTQGID